MNTFLSRDLTFSVLYYFILIKQEQIVLFHANSKGTENIMEYAYKHDTCRNTNGMENNVIKTADTIGEVSIIRISIKNIFNIRSFSSYTCAVINCCALEI